MDFKVSREFEKDSFIEPNQCGKEFIKTVDNKYIFQNRNGNVFIKTFYESEVAQYDTVSWINMLNNNEKPYK